MTIVDATVRLIPEVLGMKLNKCRMIVISFEFPQYTRPVDCGMKVPDVLLSGHRQYSTLAYGTEFAERRPDLLETMTYG